MALSFPSTRKIATLLTIGAIAGSFVILEAFAGAVAPRVLNVSTTAGADTVTFGCATGGWSRTVVGRTGLSTTTNYGSGYDIVNFSTLGGADNVTVRVAENFCPDSADFNLNTGAGYDHTIVDVRPSTKHAARILKRGEDYFLYDKQKQWIKVTPR